ncbi:MAG TPA: hypothetical protein VKA84_28895 [Gemmatimonadaceae bacterium]|nr:hypothetical protein [Gemmatimonadaceae bacterium]
MLRVSPGVSLVAVLAGGALGDRPMGGRELGVLAERRGAATTVSVVAAMDADVRERGRTPDYVVAERADTADTAGAPAASAASAPEALGLAVGREGSALGSRTAATDWLPAR